ncbi:MAG: hypothetical protein JWO11_212 [Nocardioides sp.]|nr:hypothetical protein [Nocardioides sp.]
MTAGEKINERLVVTHSRDGLAKQAASLSALQPRAALGRRDRTSHQFGRVGVRLRLWHLTAAIRCPLAWMNVPG